MTKKQLTINEQNYQQACAFSCAQDVAQRLIDAGIAIREIKIVGGLAYMKTGDATAHADVRYISKFSHAGITRVRALLCGCLLEWTTKVKKQEQAA